MKSLFWLLLFATPALADLNVCPKVPVASAVLHQWISAISSSSAVTQSQPAFTDISGSVASTQMPALTGDVTTSAGAVATTLTTAQTGAHSWSAVQTFSEAATPIVIQTAGNLAIQYKNPASSGFYNWFAGAAIAPGNNFFSINPSTAVDGSTIGTSVFNVSQSGIVAVPGTLNVTGLSTLGSAKVSTNINVVGATQPSQTDFTATGTTTVNASTSVVGVSTLFLTEIAIGDRISLSSAATTYRTVTAIADNTHLTLSGTIGNNTASTTINVKKAIERGNDSLGVNQFFVADNGALALGPTVNWTSTASGGGAQGFLNVTAPVASNTIVDLQFNSDSRVILRRANATVSTAAQGVGNVISAPTKVLSGQGLGTVGFQGYNEASNSFAVNTSVIASTATEDFTSTANGSKLEFSTTPNGSVASAVALTLGQDKSTTVAGTFLAPALATSSAPTTGTLCWTTGTGNVNVDTTTTCLVSTRKIKQEIKPLEAGLETIMKLAPVSYQLRPKFNPAKLGRQIGFISEEVGAIDNRLISRDEKGEPLGVRYMQLTAVLTKAIQQQQAQIEELKAQVKKLTR